MGSIPPGNIPDKIYYGYEKIGLYSLIPLVILFCLTVFSLIKKNSCKYINNLSILLDCVTLGVCLFDIIRISILIFIVLLCIPVDENINN